MSRGSVGVESSRGSHQKSFGVFSASQRNSISRALKAPSGTGTVGGDPILLREKRIVGWKQTSALCRIFRGTRGSSFGATTSSRGAPALPSGRRQRSGRTVRLRRRRAEVKDPAPRPGERDRWGSWAPQGNHAAPPQTETLSGGSVPQQSGKCLPVSADRGLTTPEAPGVSRPDT